MDQGLVIFHGNVSSVSPRLHNKDELCVGCLRSFMRTVTHIFFDTYRSKRYTRQLSCARPLYCVRNMAAYVVSWASG